MIPLEAFFNYMVNVYKILAIFLWEIIFFSVALSITWHLKNEYYIILLNWKFLFKTFESLWLSDSKGIQLQNYYCELFAVSF